MTDQACPPTQRCVKCRIGFTNAGIPIYPLLVLRGQFWCCPRCGDSYGENPHPHCPSISAIRARCDAATEGPWRAWDHAGWALPYVSVVTEDDRNVIFPGKATKESDGKIIGEVWATRGKRELELANADFIAHARQDIPFLLRYIADLQADLATAEAKLSTPEMQDFAAGVVLEAAHQRDRWGDDHDAGKAPQDWFWLLGFLGGKALRSAIDGDRDKALHHCISTAAACANWHAAIMGTDDRMRPGIDPVASGIETSEGSNNGQD